MTTRCATLLAVIAAAQPALAQQGSVQVSAAAQVVAADAARRAGQLDAEPDLGLTVHQPGKKFGTLFVDIHAIRRGDRAQLGRSSIALRDVKIGGIAWTFSAGDGTASPSLSDYTFANLFAPQVTFAGGTVSGFTPRGSVKLTAGRVTVLRNIFGSDPQAVDQDMGLFGARFRPAPAVELSARASRVRTRDTREFTTYIDAGDDAGAGLRVRPTAVLELVADAGISRFRRRGLVEQERDFTALLGAKWAAPRGWIQVNAQRFSPGYFAVVNTPYRDRQGVFAAAEFQIWKRLRLFGGGETTRTNLDPEASAAAATPFARGTVQRAFGGVRLHAGGRTFVTVRAEDGDRRSRPVSGAGLAFDSDTGVLSAEIQTAAKKLTGFARYERRENVDHRNSTGTYSQQTTSAQLFGRVHTSLQLFGSAMLIEQARETGGGQTFWQAGGGLQLQLARRQLWFRTEGLFSRSGDWQADTVIPHELFTIGLSGRLTSRTTVSLDVMVDRAAGSTKGSSPWLGRSMIRLVHSVPTGSARVATAGAAGAPVRRRGSGNIFGIAFADWNANGARDAGEEPIAGVPFTYRDDAARGGAPAAQVSTGTDGEFAFLNVPDGRATVALDLAALPVDFDAPDTAIHDTEVRGRRADKLAFGLVPLGSIDGTVLHDADGDGRSGPGDTPIDEAVLVLDEGQRSEQSHAGRFRFDAVRVGPHVVQVLVESLPEGAQIAGADTASVVLDRSAMHASVGFLVKLEKRPEIRKVFPPRSVSKGTQTEAPRASSAASPAPAAAARAAARRTAPGRPGTAGPHAGPARTAAAHGGPDRAGAATARVTRWYAVQLAAMRDAARAWSVIRELQARGVEAYLSLDADGLAKVRVGSYRSRAEAQQELAALRHLNVEGWIARIGG